MSRSALAFLVLLSLAVPVTGESEEEPGAAAAESAGGLKHDLRTVSSLTAQGRHGEASAIATRLIAEYPGSIEAHIAYQDLQLAAGADKALVKEYAARAAGKEATADSVYLHARLLSGNRSISLLKKALKFEPMHFHSLCSMGSKYTDLSKYRDAEKYLALALRADGESATPLCCLGWMEECRGDDEKAEKRYREAIERDPGHAVSHLNLGMMLVDLERLDEADALLKIAARHAPGSPMPVLGLGMLQAAKEETEEAQKLYERAVQMETNTVTSLNMLGSAYTRLAEYKLARRAFNRANQMAPNNELTLLNLCYLNLVQGRGDEAHEWVRRALKVDSKSAHANYFLGVTLVSLGKNRAAESAYQRAAKLDPECVLYWRALGALYSSQGKWKDAIRGITHALGLDPDANEILLDLAFAYSGSGEPARAAEAFEDVLNVDPDELSAWLNLGLLYQEKLRKPEKAVLAFKEYLDRGGKDERVKQWLDNLQRK